MIFQVLEIVGKQLQKSILRLPSDFVECKISFRADKTKYKELIWGLWQEWAVSILKFLKPAFFVHLLLRAFVIILKANWTFFSQLYSDFACEWQRSEVTYISLTAP